MDELTDIREALRIVLAAVETLPGETVALGDALGRVLAQDARADLDQPAFDRGVMDGVAVRAADCATPGTVLREIGEARAGTPFVGAVQPQTCIRILTGAVVPAGVDAVVPQERIEAAGPGLWRILDAIRPERHIARRGSEVAIGDVVVAAGEQLGAARLGVLAAFGHAQVPVRRRPVVAVLPTGDELVPVTAVPGPGQIRDSNLYTISGLVQAAGGSVVQCRVAGDDRAALGQAIEAAWQQADVIVLSGGVSVGAYDFVAPALHDVGATCHVHRIRIKPGKPFLFATRGKQLAFGLPGNPVSAYVCAVLFLQPALAALQGARRVDWQTVPLPSLAALPPVGPRTEIAPARLRTTAQGVAVEILPQRGSADLAHFAQADFLVVRPAAGPALAAGDPLDVLL